MTAASRLRLSKTHRIKAAARRLKDEAVNFWRWVCADIAKIERDTPKLPQW